MKSLTRADFQNATRLYYGRKLDRFYFDGYTIIKLENGMFLKRRDYHLLPMVGFRPDVELFRIYGELVLIYCANWVYTYVTQVKVIEAHLTRPFTGFAPENIYEFDNRQVWQQVGGPFSNCSSSGFVRVVDDRKMQIDSWDFFPEVRLIKER